MVVVCSDNAGESFCKESPMTDVRAAQLSTISNAGVFAQLDSAGLARQIANDSRVRGRIDVDLVRAKADQLAAQNPELAASIRKELDSQMTPVERGQLAAAFDASANGRLDQSKPMQIAAAPKSNDSIQRNISKALDSINLTGKLQDFLQPQLAKLTKSAGLGKTEWGASLQKVLDTPGSAKAFREGINQGIINGGKDMVVGIATLAGTAAQYGADKTLGGAGDALRGVTGKMPGWLDAIVPSEKRGNASDAALEKLGSNVGNYVSSRSQNPDLLTSDVKNAINSAWGSLKADHAKAAAQGPQEEARWWGETIGRVTFEVAATVVPVAGIVGKADKAADVARATTKLDDAARVANAIPDPWTGPASGARKAPKVTPTVPKAPLSLMDNAANIASKMKVKIQHVLDGEINKRGKAVGYHLRPNGNDLPKARMTARTEAPDINGIYKGKVEIFDSATGKWVAKKAESSFFPDNFTPKQIENSVRNAYADALRRGDVNGASWTGDSGFGFKIGGYVDGNTITSAFPIHTK
jgi:Bacterial EndoU nuclease